MPCEVVWISLVLLGLFWLVGVCHLDGIISAVVGWVFQEKFSEVAPEITSKGSLVLVRALCVRTTLCVQWKSHHPPPPKKSSHTTRVTALGICFNQSSYLTKCNNVGSSFFSFLHPLLPFLYILFCCSIYFVYFVSIRNGSVKNKAIALYEQLDDAEAVAELAEAKSQLQKHRRRLKRRCTEAGRHDAGEALRWERKMQTAKTRRRPSWTTERWKSEKLAEMDTCCLISWFKDEW